MRFYNVLHGCVMFCFCTSCFFYEAILSSLMSAIVLDLLEKKRVLCSHELFHHCTLLGIYYWLIIGCLCEPLQDLFHLSPVQSWKVMLNNVGNCIGADRQNRVVWSENREFRDVEPYYPCYLYFASQKWWFYPPGIRNMFQLIILPSPMTVSSAARAATLGNIHRKCCGHCCESPCLHHFGKFVGEQPGIRGQGLSWTAGFATKVSGATFTLE